MSLENHALNAILDQRHMKVNEIAKPHFREPQVTQQLCLPNGVEVLLGVQLHNNIPINQDVYSQAILDQQ